MPKLHQITRGKLKHRAPIPTNPIKNHFLPLLDLLFEMFRFKRIIRLAKHHLRQVVETMFNVFLRYFAFFFGVKKSFLNRAETVQLVHCIDVECPVRVAQS